MSTDVVDADDAEVAGLVVKTRVALARALGIEVALCGTDADGAALQA
ncbi:hypothetical protein [Martelella soudanensis]|nr:MULTISPECIES: hypothetical protein [unclassified Martelella]